MEQNQTTTQETTEVENSNIQSQQPAPSVQASLPKLKVVEEPESSADDFRSHFEKAKKGYVIQLPVCGLKIRVGTPDMLNLLLKGSFPQDMVQQALQLKGLAPKTELNKMGFGDLQKMMIFVDDFFCSAVISPQFTTDPSANPEKINVADIDVGDKLVVIELINRGVDSLAVFREGESSQTPGHNS